MIDKGKPVPLFKQCGWNSLRESCYKCCKDVCEVMAAPGSLDGVCTDGNLDLDPETWNECTQACELLQCGG
jgi:hypothetical protein